MCEELDRSEDYYIATYNELLMMRVRSMQREMWEWGRDS